MYCGPISVRSILPQPWRNFPGGSGGLALGLAESRQSGARWGDLGQRLMSGLVLAGIGLGCVWTGGLAFFGVLGAAAIGLAIELTKLCVSPSRSTFKTTRWVLLIAGLCWFALVTVVMLRLRADPGAGRANVLTLLLIVSATDIAAYITGRLVGGPRLVPRISPAKTWSGAIGGLLGAAAAGIGAAAVLGQPEAIWRAGLVAAGLGVMAEAGDLLESAMKRRFGVKDSSHLIPGHGGLLDRLDGLLAAAPVAALLALMAGPGVMLWG
ncbi:MAG: phosphatidate cytidylyltransferase [Acetobacteraceae bacterium]|nr:phosphatidate cytidylyltransferase [Acetobacteraceae bacterium]